MDVFDLPPLLLQFTVTSVLAFVLGLELHGYRRAQSEGVGFGTTRTLTLIAAAGFVLWLLDVGAPHLLYLTGLASLALWLAVDLARHRAGGTVGDSAADGGSLLPVMIVLLAYALGPIVQTQPDWFVAAVLIVAVLMLAEKPLIRRLSDAVPASEGITLAKFLLLAGLVLPLMPDVALPGLPMLTYRTVWTAVVAISGLAYLGYVAHRYVWPGAGTLLTGLIGGLYSSTAVSIVLGRQARSDPAVAAQAPTAILLAVMVMYPRLLVLIALLGHFGTVRALLVPYGAVFVGSGALAAWLRWRAAPPVAPAAAEPLRLEAHNPLDLPIALLFGGLFVVFAALTQFIHAHFGAGALKLLSLAVGLTDINPYILSLVAQHGSIGQTLMVDAILIASIGNNLVNSCYALVLSRERRMLPVVSWFALCLAGALLWTGWL